MEAVLVDGPRGPIGKFGGGLAAIRPDDLLATVHKAPMERRAANPALLNDVYACRGNQAGEGDVYVGVGMGVSTLIEWIGD
ncbi:MAG: hypothetical protein V3V55_05515 [Rhodospirillales bacterium]